MEFTQIELLEEKISLLRKLFYPETVSIPVWKTRTAVYTGPLTYESYSEWENISLGTGWVCPYNGARWFEASVTVPKSFAGKRVVLELDLGGEGTVSINGEMKCSLAHFNTANYSASIGTFRHRTRVDISDCAKGGEQLDISVQLNMNYKDHFRGHRFVKYDNSLSVPYVMSYANLSVLDENAEAYYYDLTNLMDAIRVFHSPANDVLNAYQTYKKDYAFDRILRSMNRDEGLRSRMIQAVQASLLEIPFYYSADEMRAAVSKASQVLHQELEKLPKVDRGTVYATGFSHLDLVWLWQEKHSVRKTANTFLNTLSIIDRYPEYVFTYSQPCSYHWLEKYYPEIFTRVQEKVASGNIDPIGNLWVEMDTNLAGGEAIIRQLLYGRAFYLEKFGKESDVFFMPDSFGFSASLPQILCKSGIRYFFTHKLYGNENYRFPYTLFVWQGIDGSRIPAYLMRCAYNSSIECERIDEVYHRNENKILTDTSFVTFGYGDGGGGPDYVMAENARRLRDIPGIPKVKYGTMDDFFHEAEADLENFPVWNDELYLDRHRGTYTSQAKVKKNNRQAELALRKTEIAASIREILLGISYPSEQIEKLWKKMLFFQFHDCLPGSSNTFVYEDVHSGYKEFFEEQKSLFESILGDLTGAFRHPEDKPLSWNFLSWERNGIPSMGCLVSDASSDHITVTPEHIENRYFDIKLDKNGNLISIVHKETAKEVLEKPSNLIQVFEDPAKGNLSAWDIQEEYNNVCETVDNVSDIHVAEVSPQRGVLSIERKYHNSRITQEITVYADVPRIDFVTHVDWHETMRLMKAAFYPKVQTSRASYEIQFGTVERPTHKNTEYDRMRFEACAHKWADISQTDFGVSLLNDCKYGYDICNGVMRISLLRSGIEPDYKQDQGEHEFTYSLFPHKGSWATGGTVRAAYELNVPVETCIKTAEDGLMTPCSFVSCDNAAVVIDGIKKAENQQGYILRIYESMGTGGKVRLSFAKKLTSVRTCNLMETDEAAIEFSDNGFEFETSPYCIHSFRVTF